MANRSILYEKIYNFIKAEILSGHYQPGDLLPTEQDLMVQFGVSRMTTNRALQLLSSEGIIVRRAGVGTFVTTQIADNSPSIEPRAPSPILVAEPPSGGPRQVAFVIPFLDHSFGPGLLAEVERELHRREITLSLGCSYGSQATEEEIVEHLVEAGAQGLILFPVNGEFYNPAILRLHVDNFPIVLVDKRLAGIPLPYVTSGNVSAARQLTEHLIELGHVRIAYFSPAWQDTSTLSERRDGFLQALADAGIEQRSDYTLTTIPWSNMTDGFDVQQIKVIADFLTAHPEVTAVFATDDQLAEYWFEAARSVGRQVPDDLSIVCFDGPTAKPRHWSYTCALQDQAQMAREAVGVICDQLDTRRNSDTPNAITVPAVLHMGNSTGPARDSRLSARRLVAITQE